MSGPPVESPTDAFYRRVFDQAGMAMVAANADGRIIGWNHAAYRMFGARAEDMLGTEWWDIVPQEQREQARKAGANALTHGETTEFTFEARDHHGVSRRVAAIITPVDAPSGDRIGALAVIRDISNRVVLERRLAQQSKMAALGEMAGALSHHFNNILGGVVTSVDFALASKDPALVLRVLEKTAQALTRATGLVDNLLAFAEGGYRDANLGELGEVVIDLVRRTEERLRDSNIRFDVDVKPIPIIEVPRAAMLTVLSNLVDNAVEAMPGGGVLRISTDFNDQNVMVRVGDTGCGLDEETVTRIFEPFYSTKDRIASGHSLNRGLGLAVAHGILKVLHGSIHVMSAVGEGTEFEVRLPVARPVPSA
ncbi:MAG TPA: PAS domain S-box protein [Phycisphaerae bacterium]|nr:PAS domain S-box protein [Phycisphaerae bacterium]